MNRTDEQFYIDGVWCDPQGTSQMDVLNPATEEVIGRISLGNAADIDKAVTSARKAFNSFSATTPVDRLALIERIIDGFRARLDELAEAMTQEMGSPITFSTERQATVALFHFEEVARILRTFEFERTEGPHLIVREPIGVCGLITPWNWPLNQVASKVAPALAAGCTVVLKPSEIAPLSAMIIAEIINAAGAPPGVFNLVNGDGPVTGHALAAHPQVDMMSFTGSVAGGVAVAKAAADSVKRVTQELGGKSANIILPDADLTHAVPEGVRACFVNGGQNCQSPTRMLVQRAQRDVAVELARKTADAFRLGDPMEPETEMGPMVSAQQFSMIQELIESGISEGATLVTGGLGRPAGFNLGYYVRPTVFADVLPDMRIAQQEIFGPVLSIMTYDTEDEAIEITNGTDFGLAGFVQSGDIDHARRVASRIRAGRVYLNGAPFNRSLPFGGYRQSGNGREFGVYGLEEFLEVKAIVGYDPA